MFFYILNKLLKKKDHRFNFTIIGGCMVYIIMLNYFYSNFLCLIIPLDLFLSFNYLYSKENININKGKQHVLRKSKNKISNDFIVDTISIHDTLDHTFTNIGISDKQFKENHTNNSFNL